MVDKAPEKADEAFPARPNRRDGLRCIIGACHRPHVGPVDLRSWGNGAVLNDKVTGSENG